MTRPSSIPSLPECFGRRHWSWQDSHTQGDVATTVLYLPISIMPFQLSEAAELCCVLLAIAGGHRCAEIHLGVIH